MGYLITAELLKEAVADKVEALNEKACLKSLKNITENRKSWLGMEFLKLPIGFLSIQ